MGLFQKACMTYDCHQDLAGVVQAGKEPLAPCAHTTIRADICITVDQDGTFVKSDAVDPKAPKIIIPITEASSNRTGSKPVPRPLCETLRYLLPQNEAHFAAYTAQLRDWASSSFTHPKLGPILAYVEGETILTDLLREGQIKLKDGKPDKDKLIICWRVIGLGEENSGPCWIDRSLFQAFENYYLSKKATETPVVCMVTGELTAPARQHMKGVVPAHGNAKLISSNDTENFTYRGRFSSPAQAATVGYTASQKAHNVLHWLVANQGVSPSPKAGRYFLCWAPEQLQTPSLLDSLFSNQEKLPPLQIPSDYQKALFQTLSGWKSILPAQSTQAVIAVFDAATSGRLSVTYYNELMASDFLDRLYEWDRLCCWPNGRWGIQAPPLRQIVRCAYGTQRLDKKGQPQLEVPDKLLCEQIQRLLACRIDQARIPSDLVHRLVQRVSSPLAYHRYIREEILFTTCAVIRKFHYDQYKEEWIMALEPHKLDRSYQYGRLLAVLDKAERDTYSKEEGRESNAIRMMSVFAQRPQYAGRIIWERVRTAYYPHLKPAARIFYDKLLQEIFDMLSQCGDDALDRPLGDTFPMGFYLQRKALYPNKTVNDSE